MGMQAAKFKIESVEFVRQGTYKVYINLGKEGSIRVIIYPSGPAAVLSDGPVKGLASDLSDNHMSKIRTAIRKFSLKAS